MCALHEIEVSKRTHIGTNRMDAAEQKRRKPRAHKAAEPKPRRRLGADWSARLLGASPPASCRTNAHPPTHPPRRGARGRRRIGFACRRKASRGQRADMPTACPAASGSPSPTATATPPAAPDPDGWVSRASAAPPVGRIIVLWGRVLARPLSETFSDFQTFYGITLQLIEPNFSY